VLSRRDEAHTREGGQNHRVLAVNYSNEYINIRNYHSLSPAAEPCNRGVDRSIRSISKPMEFAGGSSGSDSEYANSWVSWFLGSKGNEYFCEIDDDYMNDRFNLTYLNNEVQNYTAAFELMTDALGMGSKIHCADGPKQSKLLTGTSGKALRNLPAIFTVFCMLDTFSRLADCRRWCPAIKILRSKAFRETNSQKHSLVCVTECSAGAKLCSLSVFLTFPTLLP
jgi:Casein kinase II regulatory subunit